jgi:hypothetical protein
MQVFAMSHQREETGHVADQLFVSCPGIVEVADLWVQLGAGLESFWLAGFRAKLGVVTGIYVIGMLVGILLAAVLT